MSGVLYMAEYVIEVNAGYGPEIYVVYARNEDEAIDEALARADCEEPHSVKVIAIR